MEIRVALRRDVDDYRFARALDLHGVGDRSGCCKISQTFFHLTGNLHPSNIFRRMHREKGDSRSLEPRVLLPSRLILSKYNGR